VAAVAHDLKEPMRTIFCCAERLERKMENSGGQDARGLLAKITKAAERMQLLIDDSIEFSLAGGCAEENMVNAGDALQFARSNLQTAIAEASAIITSEPLPFVAANFGALIEILQNLIANAVKYRGQEAPRIHVGCSRSGSEWVLSIADNGIGIELEYRDDVFLPLKRLHTQAQYPGTGLGLAICKRIVEAHGGRIWLESTPGTGTTVYFTMPDGKRHAVASASDGARNSARH
jgi:light-regulated signal transduction histidine kinase (bacteriophytochrome)